MHILTIAVKIRSTVSNCMVQSKAKHLAQIVSYGVLDQALNLVSTNKDWSLDNSRVSEPVPSLSHVTLTLTTSLTSFLHQIRHHDVITSSHHTSYKSRDKVMVVHVGSDVTGKWSGRSNHCIVGEVQPAWQ